MNVALTKELESFIDILVKSGRYRDRSDVVRAGLRVLQKEEQSEPAWLEAEIARGIDSGTSIPLDESFWTDFEKRAGARLSRTHK